jgi:universal stress protein A
MKLLLAVDGSEYSQEAVSLITAHFNSSTTEIRLLHVLSPGASSTPPQPARRNPPEIEEIEKGVPFSAEHLADALRRAGFRVDSAVETGEVRSTIIDFAVSWGADLIVIGSHAHEGLSRFLLGSVAESVVRHAPCSVLVVRRPAPKAKPN